MNVVRECLIEELLKNFGLEYIAESIVHNNLKQPVGPVDIRKRRAY